MSGPIFTPPSAEVAEMNRIHYDLEYTEGISQRMRIPEILKVAPDAHSHPGVLPGQHLFPIPSTLMQVPERIIIAGDDDDDDPRPHVLDLIQFPMDLLDMKAPPRVLTLSEQPLESLETERTPSPQAHVSQGVRSHSRSRRERSVSENMAIARHASHASRGDMSVTPSPSAVPPPPLRACPPLCSPQDANINLYTAGGVLCYIQSTTRRAYQQLLDLLDDRPRRTQLDMSLDLAAEESSLVDASSLRRQIVKLNRRLQLLEEENKERSRREMLLYSATVAFWLVNTWTWFRR